ncbi:MAG: JmjC domain-containing protein [Acidiferrobacterales bacterium]
MPDVDKPALQELVSPHSVDDLERHWPDKPEYFLTEGDVARLPKFLHSEELGSFEALASVYSGGAGFVNAVKSAAMMPVDSGSSMKLFRMGLTIFFDNITPFVPGAVDFLRQLEVDLGINTGGARLTAWASPCENGVAAHYDCNDVISIQLLGTKRFELAPVSEITNPYGRHYTPGVVVRNEMYPQLTKGFPDWHEVEFNAVEMERGSVLFYPRGTWHRTSASADSFAVAIVIEPPAVVDCVLEQLRLLMLQNPRWRRPLYGAWGNGPEREAALAQATQLLQDIPAIASIISSEDLIRSTLPEEHRIASIDRDSRFQRVPLTGVSVEKSTEPVADSLEWVRITMKDEHGIEHTLGSVEIPQQYRDVVSWLAERTTPFRAQTVAAEFPAIPFDDHKKLLELCTQGGLLKLLWFPSLDDATTR